MELKATSLSECEARLRSLGDEINWMSQAQLADHCDIAVNTLKSRLVLLVQAGKLERIYVSQTRLRYRWLTRGRTQK